MLDTLQVPHGYLEYSNTLILFRVPWGTHGLQDTKGKFRIVGIISNIPYKIAMSMILERAGIGASLVLCKPVDQN